LKTEVAGAVAERTAKRVSGPTVTNLQVRKEEKKASWIRDHGVKNRRRDMVKNHFDYRKKNQLRGKE